MQGFQRSSRLLAALLRAQRVPRAGVTSKPPEHPVSPAVYKKQKGQYKGEQAIAMTVMFTCLLGPAAWVLAHVEHYKSRAD